MSGIAWQPVSDMPTNRMDGRQMLLAFHYENGTINAGPPNYLYETGRYHAGRWIDIDDHSRAIGRGLPDAWADLTPP